MSNPARILVATDAVADADLVRTLLRDEFDNMVGSTHPDRAIQDFEKHRPEVLILAFDGLEKAERYYLGLYGSKLPERNRGGLPREVGIT